MNEVQENASVQPWRVEGGRVVLLAYRHRGQDALYFPPLPSSSPLAGETIQVPLTGAPTLYSFTVMHPSPKTGKPPMPLGFADYPEGVRIFGQLLYPQDRRPAIGDVLEACLIDSDDGQIYAFRLNEAGARR